MTASIVAPGLFISGTGTDVGKTFVASVILRHLADRGLSMGAYKPVVSGAANLEQSDAAHLWNAIEQRRPIDWITPQFFMAPLAPPVAAELEGRVVDEARLVDGLSRWQGECDAVVVEGAGGLFSPISQHWTNADLAKRLGLPIVIVTEHRLGVVHQVLATLLAMRHLGLETVAIVLNEAVEVSGPVIPGQLSHEHLLKQFLASIGITAIVTKLAHRATEFEPAIDWAKLCARS